VYQTDPPPYLEKYAKVGLGGDPHEFTTYYPSLDKHFMISVVSPQAGKFATITTDISEQKKIEQELIDTKNFLSDTEKTGKIGGWVVDLEKMKQTWTEETYRIHEVDMDFKPDVSKGFIFYAPSSRPIIERAFNNTIETGEPFDLELEFITAKGNKKWVHSVGKAQQVDGVTKVVSGSFQDITERKQAEEELKNYRDNLEDMVKERTRDLGDKNKELDRAIKVFVGRELKIRDLEKKIREIERNNSLFSEREFRIKELKGKVKELEEKNEK